MLFSKTRTENFLAFTEKYSTLIIGLFFLFLFALGISIYQDFGLSWDENVQLILGKVNWAFLAHLDFTLLDTTHTTHGPLFTTVAYAINQLTGLTEKRDIFLQRHLIGHLLFLVSTFFFFRLGKEHFKSWKLGLFGVLLLILSPRIYAHSFFNPKDLPMLSMSIIAFYTMLRFLRKPTFFRTIIHALCCALVIDIRLHAIVIPTITVFMLLFQKRVSPCKTHSEVLRRIAEFSILSIGFVILFWPVLWGNPIGRLLGGTEMIAQYPWPYQQLYFGNIIGGDTPWHYAPVWIGITTPLVYLLFFIFGSAYSAISIYTRPWKWNETMRDRAVFLCWFFGPLLAVILLQSTLYNGWRHLYFIYPALLLLSLTGFREVARLLSLLPNTAGFFLRTYSLILLGVYLFGIAGTMIRYHPYGHVYFNEVIGGIQRAQGQFELDYWGLSFREALEKLARTAPEKNIYVYPSSWVFREDHKMLSDYAETRLHFVPTNLQARYHLGFQPWHNTGIIYDTIERDGVPLVTVYSQKPTDPPPPIHQ